MLEGKAYNNSISDAMKIKPDDKPLSQVAGELSFLEKEAEELKYTINLLEKKLSDVLKDDCEEILSDANWPVLVPVGHEIRRHKESIKQSRKRLENILDRLGV